MAYFDTTSGKLLPQKYSWDSLVLETWDSAINWDDYTGSYTSSVGVPDITFTTQIMDNGTLSWVNPLCSVESSGTHVIKVYAAESIDSSSLLPGDPVIDTSDSTTRIPGVYGRYFQFRVEVFDGADSYISQVRTDISTQEQIESISGNSSDHGGSQLERIVPITKEYSTLTAVTGNAQATSNKIPIITIGSLGEPTEPRYTVWNMVDIQSGDSSTVLGVGDTSGNNTTITTLSGSPAIDERSYKWSPASIQFNVVNPNGGLYYGSGTTITDTDDAISIPMSGIPSATGQDFTIQGWVKIWGRYAGIDPIDPQYAHPEYFLQLGDGGTNGIRLRSDTSSGKIRFQYEYNNTSTWTDIDTIYGTPDLEGSWHYFRVRKANSGIHVAIGNTEVFISGTDDTTWGDVSGFTLQLGDLGSVDDAALWMDDIKISKTSENIAEPGAEFVLDSDDMFYMNGAQSIIYADIPANINRTDAQVNIVVTGLPKMIIDSQGNIVEQ